MQETLEPVTTEGPTSGTLSWFDGFSLAMCIPNGIITSLGYTIAAVGAWPALLFWSLSTSIAYVQNYLYAEMAMMFPKETGGIALYANHAWRRYSTLVGPLATFGYWVGWSLTLGVVGETLGSLIQAQWFPHSTWSLHGGPVTMGLPQLLAIFAIVASWLTNILGIRVAAAVNRVISVSFMIFVALVLIAPAFAGGWHMSRLSWHVGSHPVITMLVWMYAAAWTVYGTEICATFAPEYRQPGRDTFRAMKYSALFVFATYLITPLSATGVLGESAISANPITYTVLLLQQAFGSGITDIVMIVIAAELLLAMIAASADGGRAIFGIAQQGLTLRQFEKLNRFGEPGRALTMDMVVNTLVVLLVSSPLAILLAANLGYMLCTVFAVSGFLLLRKDRPNWTRPIKLARPWVVLAVIVLLADIVITAIGATHPQEVGYGSMRNVLIAVGVLLVSLVLYVIRRVGQDHERFVLREADA
ncbi:APC family permease [Trebonia kvetii]|nr:APC family permease [Trebonia kvetii]